MQTLKSAARWYVYTLSDPRDGAVFYVGKGSGGRIHQHEKDAANPRMVCSRKLKRIRDLQSKSLEVDKAILAQFWDEQAAYDHETDLIEEIGLEVLTNVLPGGQKAWNARRLERAERREKDKPLHVWLAKKGGDIEILYARFAEWLKIGGHKGNKVKITTTDERFKINAQVSEVVYNTMLPSIWEQVMADASAQIVFRDRIRRYGIEVA